MKAPSCSKVNVNSDYVNVLLNVAACEQLVCVSGDNVSVVRVCLFWSCVLCLCQPKQRSKQLVVVSVYGVSGSLSKGYTVFLHQVTPDNLCGNAILGKEAMLKEFGCVGVGCYLVSLSERRNAIFP